MEDIERTWFPQYHYDIAHSTSAKEGPFSVLSIVTLRQLRFAYIVLGVGIAVASIACIMERYLKLLCVNIGCTSIRVRHHIYAFK